VNTLPYPSHWRVPAPIAWEAFKAEFLPQYLPPQRAKATCKKMAHVVDLVDRLLGKEPTTAVFTPAFVSQFIASRPAKNSVNTTISELACLRTICTYAQGMGYLDISPFRMRKRWLRPAPAKVEIQFHSREDIAAVMTQAAREVARKKGWAQWRARRVEALIAVAAYTGMRKMEALCLKVEDIDLPQRIIRIVSRDENRLKTDRSAQPVPIPPELAQILANWLPRTLSEWAFPNATHNGPWTGGSPGYQPLHRLKRIAKRAGVEGFTFLSLRHSWATHAEFWGLSDTMIQRVMRHTTTRTQAKYRHADLTNMREKTDSISFKPTEGHHGS
jgi:integrase